MQRSAFLTGTTAALAARPARAQSIGVGDLVERFPGIIGIYCRLLTPAPPLVAVRAREPFAAASIIKLPIMLTVYRAYERKTASPGEYVTLLPGDITEGAPVLGDAHSGQRWPIGALVDAMIKYSDNIASNALISHFGFTAINETIRSAGMTGTLLARHFAGEVPPGRRNLNVTTPRDIGLLLYEIERGAHEGIPTVASPESCRAMVQTMLGQAYREMIPAGVRRHVPIANKTGELDNVRSDAAIVDPRSEDPYVLVILTRDLDYPGLAYGEIAEFAQRIDKAIVRRNR
ncbi:MAG: serine hydrolase [Candidatus Lustribacter sp.]|jgi:beta-lactamase class A